MSSRSLRCAVVVLALVLAACGGGDDAAGDDVPAPTEPTTAEEPAESSAPSCLDSIPIDVAVGQIPLLLVGPGADISGFDGAIGGVGLIETHTAESVSALRSQLDAFAVPGLLASDEEGGQIQRVRSAVGDIPSAAQMGTRSPDEVKDIYTGYSRALAELGIDVNFAPVVDVGSDAIGDRSYGDDPQLVTAAATIFADTMVAAGVFPVLKHFPGLGSASGNTDFTEASGPPLEDLRQVDLLPYVAMAGRDDIGVMMAHVAVPDVTGDVPASLSAAMYEVLTDEVGFDGLVVTDSLTAEATVGDIDGAVVASVAAGADMALFSGAENVSMVVAALTDAVADGTIPEARVRDAAGAVLEVKGIDPCSAA